MVPLTNVWRYEQTANLDGINWTSRNYDDSSWPQGPALLHFEDNPGVTPKMTPLTPGRITYYFRSHFNYPAMPAGSGLSFSNQVDDGAVIYLNGVEVRRIRMTPAPAAVGYTNLASSSAPEGIFDVFTTPAESLTNLVVGDNVLAVEVHQAVAGTNADVVFGCAVSALLPQSPAFTLQPTNTTVLDGRLARFFANASGYPSPALQWFKDGQILTNAINATLFISPAFLSHAGTYVVRASNAWGIATSTNAMLTVIPDTNGPILLTAVANKNLTNIVASFSEPLAPPTVAPASFELFATGLSEHRRGIRSAVLTGGTNVVLTADPLEYGLNYTLRANGVGDATSATNTVANTNGIPLRSVVEVVSLNSSNVWSYFQAGREPDGDWRDFHYDDSPWSRGAPLFYGSATSQSVPALVGTTLALTNTGATNAVITHYFRKKFTVPGSPDGNAIRLRHIVDDGAVFYLNGSEVHSIGMPTNRPTAYNDLSIRSVSPAYEPALSQAPFSRAASVVPQENIIAAEVHQGVGGTIDAAFGAIVEMTLTEFFPRIEIELPPLVFETAGTIPNGGRITLRQPMASNLTISLTSSDTNRLKVAETVMVPAGSTNVSFDLTLIDNLALEGPQSVDVTASGTNVVAGSRPLLIADSESTSVVVMVPPLAAEGGTPVTGMVMLGSALPSATEVVLSTTSSNLIALPASVVVPAGQTSAVFAISIPEDLLIEGTRIATVVAQVPGWPSASATISVSDNELTRLALVLPTDLREGDGLRTNAGAIRASGILTTNLVVHLQSSNPAELLVPSTVTIPAGQSNAFFDISVGDDALFDGRRTVTITGDANGFTGVTNVASVADNELHRFTFGAIASPQAIGVGFDVTITARTIDGEQIANFQGNTPLSILSSDGPVPFTPVTAGPFAGGQWTGSVTINNAARLVRLRTETAPGESEWFYVEPLTFRMLSQPCIDIAWHDGSGTLFATVPPDGGTYSNRIVAIDPVSATVTNSYAIGADPSQMELSGNGAFMYVVLSNRNAFGRFNLTTRQLALRFGTGDGPVGPKWIRDFAVVGGAVDSVAATFSDRAGNSAGTWRYNSGVPIELNTFSTLDPYRLESSPTTGVLYGFQGNNSFPLMRGAAVPGSPLAVTNGLISYMWGNDIAYRFGVLYDNLGLAVQPDTFAPLGVYPGLIERFGWVALPEVDPERDRTVYLVGGTSSFGIIYMIKAFDRASFTPLAEIRTPVMPGPPGRFLLLGTNGFAYHSGGQIWFVRSESIQPTQLPANLMLSQAAAPLPAVLGSNVTYSLSLSNRGPNLATSVRVSNSLPADVTVVAASSSTGVVTQGGSVLIWTVTELAAGGTATLEFTIRHGTGGWHTNRAVVSAYEPDTSFADNVTSLRTFVQLAPDVTGFFALNLPVEDVVYDPVRDRLLLSVANAGGPNTNGIAIFNQYNGTIESFVPLGRKPFKLARSDNGQFLYVSLKEDARVLRLNLPSLTTSLEFGLGGDTYYDVFYPYYAADLAVLPGQPGSVAIWRMRRPGAMAEEFSQGIGIYDGGTLRPDVTANRLVYALEFDNDLGELYSLADLYTIYGCPINFQGVRLGESLALADHQGTDIEYAAGRMFTTAGRAVKLNPLRVDGVYSGSQNAALVEPDAATGRVFFLVSAGGAWRLNAYAMDTFDSLGSLSMANVTGTPTSLIRWGTNGLAFRTSGGQLIVIRSPLIFPDPSSLANLGIIQTGPQEPRTVGSQATFTVTVTNHGPTTATGVTLTNRIFGSVSNLNATSLRGVWTVTNNTVAWSLPSLAGGEVVVVSINATCAQPGTITSSASVGSSTTDPVSANNSAVAIAQVAGTNAMDTVIQLQLSARDLIWDSHNHRILATISTNMPNWAGGIVSIDPDSGHVTYAGVAGTGANEMALSDDGTKLFVGVDYAIQEMDTATTTRGARYAVNQLGGLDQPGDLEAVPGDSSQVVVSSLGPYLPRISLYANGIAQPSTAESFQLRAGRLEFGSDDNQLHVLVSGFFSGGHMQIYTLARSGDGLTIITNISRFGDWFNGADMRFDSGQLYTSPGRVLDETSLGVSGAFPLMPPGTLVLPEVSAARVFFLGSEGGKWVLSAWDPTTFQRLASLVIPGVAGAPAAFIRWGTDGFAFLTSSEQVFLIRSSLMPTNAPTDLAIAINESADPITVGSNLTFTVSVTNLGPRIATTTRVELVLPNSATLTSLALGQGRVQTNSQSLTLHLGDLAPGGTVNVSATVRPNSAGVLDCRAVVISRSVDPNNTNNMAVALVIARPWDDVAPITSLPLATGDIIWEPISRKIYASIPETVPGWGNSIVAIDPDARSISSPVPVGSNPRKLARSWDGQSIYVGLDRASAVLRFGLTGQSPREQFSLGADQRAEEILVSRNTPGAVVVRRWYDNKAAIYDHGVMRPAQIDGSAFIGISDTTDKIYGGDVYSSTALYRLDARPAGLFPVDPLHLKSWGVPFCFENGLCYFASGRVINPETRRVEGQFPLVGTMVAPDAASGRVYFLRGVGIANAIETYDQRTFLSQGLLMLPPLAGPAGALIRCGRDQLALQTPTQLLLIRTLVPTNPPTDLAVTIDRTHQTATVGDAIGFTLVVTNHGGNDAIDTTLDLSLSGPISTVTVSPSRGTATNSGMHSRVHFGTFPGHSQATVLVAGTASSAGTIQAVARLTFAGSDSNSENNVALAAIGVSSNSMPPAVIQIRLPTKDLVYDRTTDRLLATVPSHSTNWGNHVVPIIASSGEIELPWFAGSDPGKMAISEAGEFLYVSLDGEGAIRRRNMETAEWDLRFPVSTNGVFFASDLELRPGHAETVALSGVNVWNYGGSPGYPLGVAIYDHGIQRGTNSGDYETSRFIEFSPDGSRIYGSIPSGRGYGFLTLSVTPAGIADAVIDRSIYDEAEYEQAHGLLYSPSGLVIDPNIPAPVGTNAASGPVEPDTGSGRVFYVARNGTNWELRAFAIGTHQLLGTEILAGIQGTPLSLVRAGSNRLALHTSSNQLFIVRSALVPGTSLPAADLAVTQTVTQDTTTLPGDKVLFSITVSNRGPGHVTAVNVADGLPHPIAASSVEVSHGIVTSNGMHMFWKAGALAPGETTHLQITATVTNTSILTNVVSVSGDVNDPDLLNNVSVATFQAVSFQQRDSVQRSLVAARDLAYDRFSDRLFATVTDTSSPPRIVWFDPQTAAIGGTVNVASAPDRLAISDDGRYLYVSFVNTSSIQRVNLLSNAVDLTFDLEGSPLTMFVLPAQSRSLAVSGYSDTAANYVFAVFDDSIPRTGRVMGHPFTMVAASQDGATLVGYANTGTGGASPDLFRMNVSPAGVNVVESGPSDTPFIYNRDMAFVSNRLYFASGDVIQPFGWLQETRFPIAPYGGSVEINPVANRAIFLAHDYVTASVSIFNLNTRQQLTTLNINGIYGGASSLTQCGSDRLAFASPTEVYFVRTSFLPTADLQLSSTLDRTEIPAGQNLTISLTLSNAGPAVGNGVIVSNLLPAVCRLISASTSRGTLITNEGNLRINVDALNAGASASIAIMVQPTNTTDFVATNTAVALFVNPEDPFLQNNRVFAGLRAWADNDRDGLPDTWEAAHGFSSADPNDASADSDNDGHSNLDEFRAGTNPRDPANVLRIQSLRLVGSSLDLQFFSMIGRTYSIEYRDSLSTGAWAPHLSGIQGANALTTVRIALSPSAPLRVYRVRVSN